MNAVCRHLAALIGKDLRIESRSKDVVLTLILFALTIVVIFNFAFDADAEQSRSAAPGILWAAIAFSSSIGLGRAFSREQEEGCIFALVLSPIDPGVLYSAKFLGNLIFLVFCEAIFLPIFWILFDLPGHVLQPMFGLVLLLGSAGFAAVGTLFSAIAAESRARELMLPILMLPVLVPVILAALNGTRVLFDQLDRADLLPWIKLLVGFDLIFFVICFLLYPYIVGE
ncbi:heme exporter protein CcmB [candidate division KSB1 bacterium]|nr:heme exporter protein CcmB [candidate division KSB1 bacterium]